MRIDLDAQLLIKCSVSWQNWGNLWYINTRYTSRHNNIIGHVRGPGIKLQLNDIIIIIFNRTDCKNIIPNQSRNVRTIDWSIDHCLWRYSMIWDSLTSAYINRHHWFTRESRNVDFSFRTFVSVVRTYIHILLDQKVWYKWSKLTVKVPGPHVPGQNSMFQKLSKCPWSKIISLVRLSEYLRSRRSEYPRQKFSVVLVLKVIIHSYCAWNLSYLPIIFCDEFHTPTYSSRWSEIESQLNELNRDFKN